MQEVTTLGRRKRLANGARVEEKKRIFTFGVSLFVGATFDSFLALLSLAVDTRFREAVLCAAGAGAGVVALFAGALAAGAGVFDLLSL